MDYRSLGTRIRAERKRLGFTQEKLAELVGISEAYLGQIERGDRILSLDTLVRIANSIDVSLDYLVSDSTDSLEAGMTEEIKLLLSRLTEKQKHMVLDTLRTMCSHLHNSN